jgi:hypothetical protein
MNDQTGQRNQDTLEYRNLEICSQRLTCLTVSKTVRFLKKYVEHKMCYLLCFKHFSIQSMFGKFHVRLHTKLCRSSCIYSIKLYDEIRVKVEVV